MAVATTTVRECLTLIKGELTRGRNNDMSEEQRYECAKKEARNHPSLNFEGEQATKFRESKTNTYDNFNAKSFLEEKLPAAVYEKLSLIEQASLSQIMNESAGVEGPGTLLYNYKTDYRQVTEFSVIEHAGEEDSKIKIHYIKITAKADCSRILFFTDCKMELNGEYKVSTFTAKNASLQDEHRRLSDSVVQQSLEFLRLTDELKALRM